MHATPGMSLSEVGRLVEDLGRAIHERRLTRDAAVDQLVAADAGLNAYGARLQLKSWEGAAARGAAAEAAQDAPLPSRPRDAREFLDRRAPIHFRFPTSGGAA